MENNREIMEKSGKMKSIKIVREFGEKEGSHKKVREF